MKNFRVRTSIWLQSKTGYVYVALLFSLICLFVHVFFSLVCSLSGYVIVFSLISFTVCLCCTSTLQVNLSSLFFCLFHFLSMLLFFLQFVFLSVSRCQWMHNENRKLEQGTLTYERSFYSYFYSFLFSAVLHKFAFVRIGKIDT